MTLSKFIAVLIAAFIGFTTWTPPSAAATFCTRLKAKMAFAKKRQGNSNGKYFAAYADGKGNTISGIKGCGSTTGASSVNNARYRALSGCKRFNRTGCRIRISFRWGPTKK